MDDQTSLPVEEPTTKQRPAIFRALGDQEPPERVQIKGETYHKVELLKHDSWAATGIYQGPVGKAICKFNRQQSILRFPMGWLGDILASRERAMLLALEDVPNVPNWLGHVTHRGRRLTHVVAREYIEGHPLGDKEHVNDEFFPTLRATLNEMHQRNLAYVDLHKRENVLVGDDGQPYLIDFQISAGLADWPILNNPMTQYLLGLLQRSDSYHLEKLHARCRPDLCEVDKEEIKRTRPWWIRFHRSFSKPLREMRRKLLVLLRIRSGQGRASSEVFAEDAFRTAEEQPRSAA